MIPPARGAFIAAACILLGGCFAPMTQREAQDIAQARLARYCAGRCGALALGHTQKIKDRYLVDYEAPRQKFTVIVENDGNSQVTVWDKSRDATGQ